MAHTGLADAMAPDADAMSAATKDAVDVRMVSTKELQAHAAADDLWISISGDVYDVTPWLRHHPGGESRSSPSPARTPSTPSWPTTRPPLSGF
ncbi:hypothetical protein D1007_12372 [Hordeum vulgare]|nr:hypothetical protein D1007_12372 [Hordeum vulgare]